MHKILIVNANFYAHISALLVEGAVRALQQAGAAHEIINVKGALEVPATIGFAATAFDGFVALGCVIRGETSHYDVVVNESARGLQYLALQKHLAIGNGILTVENESQAIVRAHPLRGDKGGFAADACLQQLAIKHRFNV